MSYISLLITVLFTFLPYSAGARELTELDFEIVTESGGSEGKQEAFDKATEQATQQMVQELLGPEKAAKHWTKMREKLLRQSTRYILFIKGSTPSEGASHRVQVHMKVSHDNLESILREQGALGSGSVKLLALVQILELKTGAYTWWAFAEDEKTGFPQDLFRKFFAQLSNKAKAKNVYVLDANNSAFRLSIPAAYRSANLRREDQMLLAQYLKADVVLSGRILVGRTQADNPRVGLRYELQVWQAKSARVVSEVQRTEDVPSEVPKVVQGAFELANVKVIDELMQPLADALNNGNMNLNVMRLSVNGSMSYRQAMEFKKQLAQVREVRLIKERLFEPSRITYEVESPMSSADLAKVVQKTNFPLYSVGVDSVQDNGLALNVKALSSSSAH